MWVMISYTELDEEWGQVSLRKTTPAVSGRHTSNANIHMGPLLGDAQEDHDDGLISRGPSNLRVGLSETADIPITNLVRSTRRCVRMGLRMQMWRLGRHLRLPRADRDALR